MKNKDLGKEIEPKFKIVRLMDGLVDFSKFEIKISQTRKIYKVIRDSNEDLRKRKRPVYSGIVEAIFYETEQNFT